MTAIEIMEIMIADINSALCSRLEAITCSGQFEFDSSLTKLLVKNWPHPTFGDLVKTNDKGEVLLGCPGTLYTHGWHYHEKPIAHLWLLEQEKKYPTFIEKVWKIIK